MNAVKEPILVIYQDGKAAAIIKRDEESKKQIIFAIEEMNADDIESLFSRHNQNGTSEQNNNAGD